MSDHYQKDGEFSGAGAKVLRAKKHLQEKTEMIESIGARFDGKLVSKKSDEGN